MSFRLVIDVMYSQSLTANSSCFVFKIQLTIVCPKKLLPSTLAQIDATTLTKGCAIGFVSVLKHDVAGPCLVLKVRE